MENSVMYNPLPEHELTEITHTLEKIVEDIVASENRGLGYDDKLERTLGVSECLIPILKPHGYEVTVSPKILNLTRSQSSNLNTIPVFDVSEIDDINTSELSSVIELQLIKDGSEFKVFIDCNFIQDLFKKYDPHYDYINNMNTTLGNTTTFVTRHGRNILDIANHIPTNLSQFKHANFDITELKTVDTNSWWKMFLAECICDSLNSNLQFDRSRARFTFLNSFEEKETPYDNSQIEFKFELSYQRPEDKKVTKVVLNNRVYAHFYKLWLNYFLNKTFDSVIENLFDQLPSDYKSDIFGTLPRVRTNSNAVGILECLDDKDGEVDNSVTIIKKQLKLKLEKIKTKVKKSNIKKYLNSIKSSRYVLTDRLQYEKDTSYPPIGDHLPHQEVGQLIGKYFEEVFTGTKFILDYWVDKDIHYDQQTVTSLVKFKFDVRISTPFTSSDHVLKLEISKSLIPYITPEFIDELIVECKEMFDFE